MSPPGRSDQAILWRGWNDETLQLINEREMPVLLFVADPNAFAWPFLREVFKELPKNAQLRRLLHEFYPALYLEAGAVPEELAGLGAGERYHIAILSPYGLTPLVTVDPVSGNPAAVVAEIAAILERLLESWR
jgi:hypothetical protein